MSEPTYICITPIGAIRVVGPQGLIGFEDRPSPLKNTQVLKIPLAELTVGESISIEFSNAPAIEYRQQEPGTLTGHGTTDRHVFAIASRLEPQAGYVIKTGRPKYSDITVTNTAANQKDQTLSLSMAWIPSSNVSKDHLVAITQELARISQE